ncbi:Tetratricopeptide repeat protein [compost metagenome]
MNCVGSGYTVKSIIGRIYTIVVSCYSLFCNLIRPKNINMKYYISFLLTVLVYSASFACYNEYYSLDSKGQFHLIDVGVIRFQKSFDQQKIERQLRKLGKKLQTKADYKLLSDYGLYLVKGGKVKEALVIFEALALAYPDEYSIIANLGTTYELSGNNEKALEYIRKGLKLNPDSHGGSEWIHVKVLLAKIALDKDPDYLSNHTVLNLSTKQEESEEVRKQLYIQLKERFPFCKAPDPVMADLFVDLGDCYLHSISFEHAKGLYQIAKIYYQSSRADIDPKIEEVQKLRAKYADRQPEGYHGVESMVSKISGVPYSSYLENPDSDNYQINWSDILTNPDQLLELVGLKRLEEMKQEPEPEKDQEIVEKPVAVKKNTKSDRSMLWIGLTSMILLISVFTYFKAKRK